MPFINLERRLLKNSVTIIQCQDKLKVFRCTDQP